MRAQKKEKRKPVICPHCYSQMVCMNRFESISSLSKGFYAWYVCPRRKGQKGCGFTSLVQVFPKMKLPSRTVFSVNFKQLTPKRKKKKAKK